MASTNKPLYIAPRSTRINAFINPFSQSFTFIWAPLPWVILHRSTDLIHLNMFMIHDWRPDHSSNPSLQLLSNSTVAIKNVSKFPILATEDCLPIIQIHSSSKGQIMTESILSVLLKSTFTIPSPCHPIHSVLSS
jgi:hypothetical protein